MIYLFIFIICYLLGSFPTAYLIVKKFTGKDIRNEGTGNVGAMNTARATRKWYLFLAVAIIDAVKGILSLYIAEKLAITENELGIFLLLSSFGVVLGHCYSVYFLYTDGYFAGGKAIATLIGVLGMLHFTHMLLPWAVAVLLPIALTGNFFLGQFTGTLALPFIGFFLAPQYFFISILIAIPVFIKQWPRVIPMLQGKEPKWYWKERK